MPFFYGLMALCGFVSAMAAASAGNWAAAPIAAFVLFALWRMERTRR